MSFFQRFRPQCRLEKFYTTGKQKKADAYSIDGFCGHCNNVFEAMRCYYCSCQKARPSLSEEAIRRGFEKRELDQLRKQYLREKDYNANEMYDFDC